MVRIRTPLQPLARGLRRTQTDAENRLWYHLRNRQLGGAKFRRQFPIGSYVVDLVCLESRLIVELDGGQHSEQVERDERRTAFLEAQGFRILRFWNNQALAETEAVLTTILVALQ